MTALFSLIAVLTAINIAIVFAVDEQAAGSPLRRMPEDLQAGSDVIDNESKRSMGLLRLGRSRWGAETSKRKMGLLRLGRGDPEALSSSVEDKRSMQLLRLGRKRDDVVGPDDMAGQMRQRSMGALRLGHRDDETEKRKMGLLRLGRSQQDADDLKRSMGLLRLG